MLIDSKLFKAKNILKIDKDSIDRLEKAKIFLVHWKDYKEEIDYILSLKKDNIAMIVYAPREEGSIDETKLKEINKKRNSVIVNFRGRLMNDILTSMVTANYGR